MKREKRNKLVHEKYTNREQAGVRSGDLQRLHYEIKLIFRLTLHLALESLTMAELERRDIRENLLEEQNKETSY